MCYISLFRLKSPYLDNFLKLWRVQKTFSQNLATLPHFFHKNVLYDLHWIFFSRQVLKICQGKIKILKFFIKKTRDFSSAAASRNWKEHIIVAAKFHLTRVFLFIYTLSEVGPQSDRCGCNKCVGYPSFFFNA